jgi:hypothetical protein
MAFDINSSIYEIMENGPKYGETNFINYVKKNLLDLIKGVIHKKFCICASCIYHSRTSKKNRKRGRPIEKMPFFIYWLWALVNEFWTIYNINEIAEGRGYQIDIHEGGGWKRMNKILNNSALLDDLRKFTEIDKYLDGFTYNDMFRIKNRYKKNGLIEKEITKMIFESAGQDIFASIAPFSKLGFAGAFKKLLKESGKFDYSFPRLIDDLMLSNEILNYIKSEGVVIKSEIRRNKRRFQRIDKNKFESIIDKLGYYGKISIVKFSGRTFLSYKIK